MYQIIKQIQQANISMNREIGFKKDGITVKKNTEFYEKYYTTLSKLVHRWVYFF
jgi:hypothetical protein